MSNVFLASSFFCSQAESTHGHLSTNGNRWVASYNRSLGIVSVPNELPSSYIPTYRGNVYFLHEKWDCLRTIGQANPSSDIFEELTFLPIRQPMPGLDEHTHPEMKEQGMNMFLGSFNTLSDVCDFMDEPYLCNINSEPSGNLGYKLKYLLRRSNNTYPHLFTDISEVPSSFSVLDMVPNKNPYYGYNPLLDVQAYDNTIVIVGGPIVSANDWPEGYQVREVDSPNKWSSSEWSFRGVVGDDIILPSTVDNEKFGELVKSVWRSQINSIAFDRIIIRHLTPASADSGFAARAWARFKKMVR